MKTQQKGFTLIELLITIAIIGALAAVAVPTYLDYLESSELESVERNCETASRFLKQEYAKMFTNPELSQSAPLNYALNDGGLASSPLDDTQPAFDLDQTTSIISYDGEIAIAIEGALLTPNNPAGDPDFAFNQNLDGGYTATITCDTDGSGDYAAANDLETTLTLRL